MKLQLAFGSPVIDKGDHLETPGVRFGRKGLQVVHRAKHALIVRWSGETGWSGVGAQSYSATRYMLVERGSWVILKEATPGRSWRSELVHLKHLANTHVLSKTGR